MLPDPLAAAGPSALPLLVELGAAALLAIVLALRGPVRRRLRRAVARKPAATSAAPSSPRPV